MQKLLYVANMNKGCKGLRILVNLQDQGILKIVGIIAKSDDDKTHWYASVSELARKYGLRLFMPNDINNPEFAKEIEKLKPDWGLSNGSGGRLYKRHFFGIPRSGFLNIHFSLLPKYRGVWPTPFAIMNGEKMTGITLHLIDDGMDTGNVIAQEAVPIFEDDTGYDVHHRCEDAMERIMMEALPRILASPQIISYKQDETRAVIYRNKDKSKKASLQWEQKRLYDFVRALDFPPYEPAYVFLDGKKNHLVLRPDRHDIGNADIDYISYNNHKIYILENSKYNHTQGV